MKRDARFYQRQLKLADKEERKYRERAKKVIERYRDEPSDNLENTGSRFNILWANTQTQLPALYSSRPKPNVRRRWREPVGKEIAQAVERALEFSMDTYNFDRVGEACILDFLLPGRMVARVRYHPVLKERVSETIVPSAEGIELGDNDSLEEQDDGTFLHRRQFTEKTYEEVRAYHVPWKHYRQTPVDVWDDVWWVAYGDNFLTKEEIIEQFGKEFDDVPLKHSDAEQTEEDESEVKRAQVWELWDKEAKKVVAFVEGYDRLLLEEEDPLRLRDFFPQPEPAVMIESPDSIIPIPEYTMYQYQAEELNEITERIYRLTKAMKAKGFYPGEESKKIENLAMADDNILVPVDNYAMMAEKGGLRNMIDWFPIRDIVEVWQRLIVRREDLTQQIFELIGVSDIQRGASDPRETRGAQELKANFGSRRLLPKKQRVERFFRDVLRIKAEIIAEHYSPRTIQAMTQTEMTPEMGAIMRNDALRSFTIDIETDSTVAADEQMEKRGVAEFMSAMSNFLGQSLPIAQANPAAVVPIGKMALWLSRKFRMARDVEDEVEEFVDSFRNAQGQQDAEAEKKKAEMQAEREAKMAELQLRKEVAQAETRLKEAQMAADKQRKDFEAQSDIARKDAEAKAKIARDNALAEAKIKQQGEKPGAMPKADIPDNVTPIRKNFSVTRDESGRISGATLSENGVTRRVVLNRDADGNVTGGDVVA